MIKEIRELNKKPDDFTVLVQHYQMPESKKPILTESQEKQKAMLILVSNWISRHKLRKLVVPMIRTKYGVKQTRASEIYRDAKLLHGATKPVNKVAERRFQLDWCYEMMRQAAEERNFRDFRALQQEAYKLAGLDKDDPADDLVAMATPHINTITNDPTEKGFDKVPDELMADLAKRYNIPFGDYVKHDELNG